MKLHSKHFILTLTEEVQVGELKATLVAHVMGNKDEFDIEFTDQINTSYMGIDMSNYQDWRKFREFHKAMGIDYDAHLTKKFDEIFTKEAVKVYVDKIKF